MSNRKPDTLEQSDAAAREQALDVSRSFMVQAPAGSGKTTVLTQRYLRLLTTVDEPEQVLAITFTRKAAGEMRERVQLALDGGTAPRTDADRVTLQLAAGVRAHAAARGWGLEDSSARLRIQTIDAFNAYLANAMPLTSQGGFGRGIAEAPEDLYAIAARETLRHAESDPELKGPFERILRRLDDNWSLLERLIASMLARRAEWLPNLPQLSGKELVPQIEQSLETIVNEELASAVARLPADFIALASDAARIAAYHRGAEAHADLAAWRQSTEALVRHHRDLRRWRALRDLSLTSQGALRAKFNKTQGFPADDPDARAMGVALAGRLAGLERHHVGALEVIALLPHPVIPEEARGALDALAKLLTMAAAQLTLVFDEQGECDYPEVAGAARRALTDDGSPTPLAERLGTRISHVLVDEFQDTSRDQFELLLTLTQDWSEGDGRTLFLVGDPMQSIYGFRNAEVGRFSTVRAAGLGQVRLHSLELRRNFRSAPALVQWCNDVFARVFPDDDDVRRSAVRHLASVAARANLEGEPRLYRVHAENCDENEAQAAAQSIAELVRTRPGESIAVLAGARTHLRTVRAALSARNVPFIGVNLEPLADVAVVRDLEALARALESPLDRIAWLAVLRAPFVGLSLPDLTVIAEAADASIPAALRENIPGLSPDGMERLLRTRAVLLRAWHERELEPRAHMVERVWLALGGPSACARPDELVSARRFLAALDEEDRGRLRGRPLDFERLMNRLFAADTAQPGAVSLMTIHGAKGLEFDHVFVLGIGRRGRGDDARLLNWLELPRVSGGDHLLMAPIRVREEGDDAEDDAINPFIELLHRERARAERSRLAYVALTRARRSLHLYLHPRQKDEDGAPVFSPDTRSLLHNLWPAIGGDIANLPVIGAPDSEAGEAGSQAIAPALAQGRRRLVRRFVAPPAPPDVAARGELVPQEHEEEAIEFSWVRQTARRVGTVVHEALERFGQGPPPSAQDLPGLRARLESRLQALGLETGAARDGAERALAALRATLEDPRGRWLFDASHRDARSELSLTGIRGNNIVNAVIDRTFVSADGVRWIVDFKTSPHEGGDLEGFLESEARRYESQLRRYAHLARELGPEPVRAGLYFPLLRAWREIDVGQ